MLTRRQFLKLAGAAGIGAVAARLLCFKDSCPDFEFLKACDQPPLEKPLVPLGEFAELQVPKAWHSQLLREKVNDEEIKKAWYTRGGNEKINLAITKFSAQDFFVPETRRDILESFSEYTTWVQNYLKPYLPANQARGDIQIVHRLAEKFSIDFVVRDDHGISMNSALRGMRWSPTIGVGKLRAGLDDGAYFVRRSPRITLATYSESKFAVLESPIAEFIHMVLGEMTDALILQKLQQEKPGDQKSINRIVEERVWIEEGAVHASSYCLTRGIVEHCTVPLRPDQIQHSFDRTVSGSKEHTYLHVPAWLKYVDAHGVKQTIDDYVHRYDATVKQVHSSN